MMLGFFPFALFLSVLVCFGGSGRSSSSEVNTTAALSRWSFVLKEVDGHQNDAQQFNSMPDIGYGLQLNFPEDLFIFGIKYMLTAIH